MVTKSIACPSCEVRLKIAATLPVGKKIKCPKCEKAFAVPDDDEDEVVDAEPVAPIRKAKAPPPPDDDYDDEEEEECPVARRPKSKGKKAKKSGGNGLLIGLGVGAFLLLFAGGGAAAFFLWPSKNKPAQAQQGPPNPPQTSQPATSPSGIPATTPPATGGEVASASGGRKVYDDAKCSRCHSIDGSKSGKAPDLSHAGASHNAEWLTEHVRSPKSHNPRSSMPAYEGKIPPQDLRALGEFLASLK